MADKGILIKNARLIFPSGICEGAVLVADGKIASVVRAAEPSNDEGLRKLPAFREMAYQAGAKEPEKTLLEAGAIEVVDADGMYLSPGFIDVHTHGGGGADFMDGTHEAVTAALRMHRCHGTTSILPTTLTSTRESLLSFLHFFNTVELKEEGMPEILGLHLEGPYFALGQRGAQDPKYLRNPEPEEYLAALNLSERILRWSFAIELPGAGDLLRELRRRGVIASMAHSDADCRQVMAAYDGGLAALTHFYSCMSGVTRKNAYRVAGAIEAGYLLDDLYVEVIADGCHLPAELLKLIYKVKTSSRICLVTDSMRAAGMPDGTYQLGALDGGQCCLVEDGVAKLPDRSAFAGSVATMDRLVRTFRNLTGAPLWDVVRMASLSPAELTGCGDRKGSICEGKDADLLLFDEDIRIHRVMIRGRWAEPQGWNDRKEAAYQ